MGDPKGNLVHRLSVTSVLLRHPYLGSHGPTSRNKGPISYLDRHVSWSLLQSFTGFKCRSSLGPVNFLSRPFRFVRLSHGTSLLGVVKSSHPTSQSYFLFMSLCSTLLHLSLPSVDVDLHWVHGFGARISYVSGPRLTVHPPRPSFDLLVRSTS